MTERRINQQELGNRLYKARIRMTLSQREMGSLLGISASYVSLLEKGKRGASVAVLAKYAELSGKSMDELIKG